MRRPAPAPSVPLDPGTLRELERLRAERLDTLGAYGPGCPSCRDGEAHAFLARLRVLQGPG